MNLKVGDKVKVIAGKDKGKEGTIIKTLRDANKVVIEDVNIGKKHLKAQGDNQGGIIEFPQAIDASNVMIIDPKTKKPTRIKHEIKDNKKIRVSASGNKLD